MLKSSLMGFWEKKKWREFFLYARDIDLSNDATWQDINIYTQPISDVFIKFKLEPNTIDFIGHAVAMHINDEYLDQPAAEIIEKIKLYII